MAATDSGEQRAWEILAALDPAEVRERTGAERGPAPGTFLVRSLGRRYVADPGARRIAGLDPGGEPLPGPTGGFFRLTLLWYLSRAARAAPTGRLARPSDLPGGGIFLKGTHVLPLADLAARYGGDPAAFAAAGAARGGSAVGYGDAAVVLRPLPLLPLTVILWAGDAEFPARADLLFDESARRQLPVDVLWSAAMLSLHALLGPP